MKLVLLVGPPGSGKSTYTKQYLEVYPDVTAYINQDSQNKEHLKLFQNALNMKYNIIVDRMNFNKEQRERYLKPAKEAGYETEIIVLHESYATCLERCIERTNHPTIKDEATAIKALNMFFTKYERVEDNEADKVTRIWPNNKKSDTVIIDLDGTLCNIDHRLHFVQKEKKDWKSFFEAIPNDKINKWCEKLIEGLELSISDIIFCSGRPEKYRQLTEDWLKQHYFSDRDLYMRFKGDYRPDYIIKEIILDFELLTRYNILMAIDDRSSVVQMWRKRGITCLQCADGSF